VFDKAHCAVLKSLLACERHTKRAAERVKSTRDKIAGIEGAKCDSARAALAVHEANLAEQCAILERLIEEAESFCPAE
jgi:hypothetical protein